jgi:hypothetical protein
VACVRRSRWRPPGRSWARRAADQASTGGAGARDRSRPGPAYRVARGVARAPFGPVGRVSFGR